MLESPSPMPAASPVGAGPLPSVPRFSDRVARHLAESALDLAAGTAGRLATARRDARDTPEGAARLVTLVETLIEQLQFAAAHLRQQADQP